MTAAIDITKEQRKTLLAILRRFIPGVAVWAYGSRVKWTARPNSDLDLVAFTTPAQRTIVSELKEAIAESDLPFLVDFHIWDEVPERFHEIIRKEYVVLQEAKQSEGSNISVLGDVGLREEAANPTYESIAGGWNEKTLGEVITLQRGFDLPAQNRKLGKVPIVSSSGITDYHSEVGVAGPGVVTGRYGTIGQVFLIKEDYWPLNTTLWVKDFHGNDTRFASYLLRTVDFRSCSDKSSVPGVNRNDLHRIPVLLPPLPEQKAIAHSLGTLDDKIELNRQMNATLEAMAQALFQSWFVDFDPVRAKLDGRKPAGLDAATAALFPSHFQDSPLGHIPQGWIMKTIGEIGNVVCGKTPSTAVSDYYGNDVPFITIPEMHGNVFAASTSRKLSHAGAQSQANKTLPPGSICVSCIATPGLVVITSENSQTNQQINSVIPHESNETYFWYWVMTGLGAEIAASGSGGSVLTNLSKGRFETLQVIKPPHDLIRAYHTSVRPHFENILANTHQSRTLATMRDAMLPKLLSGEVTINEN